MQIKGKGMSVLEFLWWYHPLHRLGEQKHSTHTERGFYFLRANSVAARDAAVLAGQSLEVIATQCVVVGVGGGVCVCVR